MLQQSCTGAPYSQLHPGEQRSAGQLRRVARRCRPASASALDVALGPAVDVLPPRRAALKKALLSAVAPTSRGARASPAQAAAVRSCLGARLRCRLTRLTGGRSGSASRGPLSDGEPGAVRSRQVGAVIYDRDRRARVL